MEILMTQKCWPVATKLLNGLSTIFLISISTHPSKFLTLLEVLVWWQSFCSRKTLLSKLLIVSILQRKCWMVPESLDFTETSFDEAVRVLKKGGYVINVMREENRHKCRIYKDTFDRHCAELVKQGKWNKIYEHINE